MQYSICGNLKTKLKMNTSYKLQWKDIRNKLQWKFLEFLHYVPACLQMYIYLKVTQLGFILKKLIYAISNVSEHIKRIVTEIMWNFNFNLIFKIRYQAAFSVPMRNIVFPITMKIWMIFHSVFILFRLIQIRFWCR